MVYKLALCSFSDREEPTTLLQYPYSHVQGSFPQLRFHGTINLLGTNKQIYTEGHQVMFKKNLFIHIKYDGLYIQDYVYNEKPGLPIVTRRSIWHGLHDIPPAAVRVYLESYQNRKTEAYQPLSVQADLVILWTDFEEFCTMFEVERALSSQGELSIEVQLNPGRTGSKTGDILRKDFSGYFTRKTQERLLAPIKDALRGCSAAECEFRISACNEEDLVESTTLAVLQPRWPSLEHLVLELEYLETKSRKCLSKKDILSCVQLCNTGVGTLLRFQRNKTSVRSYQNDVRPPTQALTRKYFAFYSLIIRCLTVELSDSAPVGVRDDVFKLYVIIVRIFTFVNYVLGVFPMHWLSEPQLAEWCYLSAVVMRVYFERSFDVLSSAAVNFIVLESIGRWI